MIRAVLDTDMTKHSKHLGEIQTKLQKTEELKMEKEFVIGTILHLADLSNPCRCKRISEEWARRVSEEFFLQGDLERENFVEINLLCDRTKVNIAKSQIGFISGVIAPFLAPICKEIPQLKFLQVNLEANRDGWAERIEEFQQKLDISN